MEDRFVQYVLHPFLDVVQRFPDRNALFIADTFYSYHSLFERVTAIRMLIREEDSSKDVSQVWAIALHDDLDTYACVWALWLEGKAYVGLHPNQPVERSLGIIRQVGTKHILDSVSDSMFANSGYCVHDTNKASCHVQRLDIQSAEPNDLAYMIFTSGSTGTPKGACLSRHNLGTFVRAMKDVYAMDETDRCLQCFDLTFDLSVMSFVLPLTVGACAYTVPYNVVKYICVAQLLEEQQLTFSMMTPSVILYLQPYFKELHFPAMRCSLFAGEALTEDLALGWAKCLPNAMIVNSYGPTETTIIMSSYLVNRSGNNLSHNGILSLGKDMWDTETIIVDENDQIIPKPDSDSPSEIGELCMTGGQVMPGYCNNPTKNAEVFFFKNAKRFYRSGDMGYYAPDGNMMFSSRKDFQVKIQGFRIELGEIEHHARSFFHAEKKVLAMAFTNSEHLTEVALFVEAAQQDATPLVEYLRAKMPPYMIPTRILFIEEFPLNKNVKIDRTALKALL